MAALWRLHGHHGWTDKASGKKVSIGLVRMANIRPAIQVANHLADKLGTNARVACYHANQLAIKRFHIERRLDHLLTRKSGNQGKGPNLHITSDPEIRSMLDDPSCQKDLLLIVVATPVEEIGRDHDFDWAVIEPSSSQSIVQTGGRVNRHRLAPISEPNIAILQYNFKCVDGGNQPGKVVFNQPGLETAGINRGTTHRSHDLKDLLAWRVEQGELRLPIDARLRFDTGSHPFAADDDKATERATQELFAAMSGTDALGGCLWMSAETYTKAPLREKEDVKGQARLSRDLDNADKYNIEIGGIRHGEGDYLVVAQTRPPLPNAWLTLTDEQAADLSSEIGVSPKDALAVTLRLKRGENKQLGLGDIRRHPDYGFYTAK